MAYTPTNLYNVTMKSHKHASAWVISTNMGYGHARAAHALKDLAHGDIINANDYEGIPEIDKKRWRQSRKLYEAISRLKPIPVIGSAAFYIMDSMQRIAPFYPRRDLSKPSLQTRQAYFMVKNLGVGRHLVEKLSSNPLPFISTFPIPAFAAEEFDYPGDIYLVVTDADMNRAWVPMDPKRSRIKYFAPNGRVVERLKLYGVRAKNIFLTGFPLPKEVIGGPDSTLIRDDLRARICNLDPNGIFLRKYQKTLETHLGVGNCVFKKKHPLTLTYVVGGAGAQRALGGHILKSLKHQLLRGKIQLNLIAGTHKVVEEFYLEKMNEFRMSKALGKSVFIHTWKDRPTYFHKFSALLRKTDILWTKPSEMSFYSGIGLPIIMAPPIGSQEDFNKTWLTMLGSGTTQGNPKHVDEWLFDWINSGGLARMAWNGFTEAPTLGAYRIESIITGESAEVEQLPLIV